MDSGRTVATSCHPYFVMHSFCMTEKGERKGKNLRPICQFAFFAIVNPKRSRFTFVSLVIFSLA
jgi:hypothetical protein